jgi:2-haloacid dehalogenase
METFPQAREHFTILQMIDRYVVSGAEHLVKPDPRLFQVLLDRYGLRAEECTFVDDNPVNVEAARRMGMRGIQFVGAEKLRKELAL